MGRSHLSPIELSALADGELTPAELSAAREHLFECASCSSQHRAIQQLDLGLRQVPALDCEAILPLLSARHDGELDDAERAVAERHLMSCVSCRALEASWMPLAPALALLPSGAPSARVDRAIATLTGKAGRRSFRPVLLPRALVAATATIALVVALLSRETPVAQIATPNAPQVLVAAAQEIVLNARTNTLYVLDRTGAAVDARDATTNDLKTRIDVGGRPTALALNAAANVVLVLDASAKTVTEIDSVSNTVVGSTAVSVAGKPTSIFVDPSNNKIVVTAGGGTGASGSLAVIDGTTKKVESVRDFSVAPEAMVFSPEGDRAVVVSKDASTLVDASYKVVGTLPGGVGAAFAQGDDRIAILAASGSDSVVRYVGRGAPGDLLLAGAPRAIASLPDGGFLVLVSIGDRSRVSHVAPDGHEAGSVDLAIAGRDLVYDPTARRFSVANGGVVVSADVPNVIAAASPTPRPAPSQSATQSPAASESPAPSGSAAPSGSPAATTSPTPNPLAQASPVAAGFVHVDLPGGRAPFAVSQSGERLWVIDDQNAIESIDLSSGAATVLASLPRSAQITQFASGRAVVYALDARHGDLYVLDATTGTLRSQRVTLLKPVSTVAVGVDDHLFIGLSDSALLLRLDPRTGLTESFDLKDARISKLTTDALGRVYYADDARNAVGLLNPATGVVTEFAYPRSGATTALVVDGSSTLWLGTSSGELWSIRGGTATLTVGLQRPVTTISLDAAGRAWYLSPLPAASSGFHYGAADGAAVGRTVAGPAFTLAFSALGQAWLGDPRGGFYVSRSSE